MKKKLFFGWTNIKWFIKELIATFSHQPSYFSHKRIQACLLFINANVMLDVITFSLLQEKKIDYLGAVAIYGAQMVYAGYQVTQIMKDKVQTQNQI